MKKKFIGMDLGLDEIRVAVVDPENGKVSPAFYVNWDPDTDGLDGERAALSKKVNEISDYDDLILSFPPSRIFSHYMELPPLSDDQLQIALNTRIRKFFPFKDNIHTLANVEIPPISGDKKKKGHMVFIVFKQGVDNQVSLLKSLALKVTHIDVPHNGLTRWLLFEDKNLAKGNHIFIMLHKDAAIIGAFKDMALYYTGSLIPPLFELDIWKQRKVTTLKTVEPFIDNLVSDIMSVVNFIQYRLTPCEINPDSIILIGECHTGELLKAKLEATTCIPIVVKGTTKLTFDDTVPPDERCLYTISGGLSLRVLEESIWVK